VPAQLIALAAALSYAISGIAAKRGLRYSTPITVTLVSVAIHATLLWIALLIFRGVRALAWRVLFLFVLSGLLQPILRFLTYAGIHYVGAAAGTTLRGAHPLFSTSLAILFLGEPLNLLIVLGTIAIVAGVALISWQGSKKQASFRWWHLAYPLSAAFLARRLPPAATLHTQSRERAALSCGGHRYCCAALACQRYPVAGAKAKTGMGSPGHGSVCHSRKL
jgi:drug/metabolite transporter (DMT)-like permease